MSMSFFIVSPNLYKCSILFFISLSFLCMITIDYLIPVVLLSFPSFRIHLNNRTFSPNVEGTLTLPFLIHGHILYSFKPLTLLLVFQLPQV